MPGTKLMFNPWELCLLFKYHLRKCSSELKGAWWGFVTVPGSGTPASGGSPSPRLQHRRQPAGLRMASLSLLPLILFRNVSGRVDIPEVLEHATLGDPAPCPRSFPVGWCQRLPHIGPAILTASRQPFPITGLRGAEGPGLGERVLSSPFREVRV